MATSDLMSSDIYLTMLPDKFYEKLQSLVALNACILKVIDVHLWCTLRPHPLPRLNRVKRRQLTLQRVIKKMTEVSRFVRKCQSWVVFNLLRLINYYDWFAGDRLCKIFYEPLTVGLHTLSMTRVLYEQTRSVDCVAISIAHVKMPSEIPTNRTKTFLCHSLS